VLSEAGVPPQRLELEITESLLVQDLRSAARRLAELDELGFLIALDDFGTGYSSLSYLHSLPLHALKIDRQFVSDLRDGRSGTITRTIVSMAHHLGIIAIAEGVETEAQRDVLSQAGCDVVQGFLYAPPLPTAAFERLVERRTRPDGAQVPVAAGTP
jgi:EAL domain-containing protein (putative c-di-GMP-specific phosphodiesterase class I)